MSNVYKNVPDEMCAIIDNISIENPVLGKVYRVSKTGRKDAEAFDNTYCEVLNGTTGKNKNYDDPGTYSTSVYLIPEPCEKFIKILAQKHKDTYPSPAVLVGNIHLEDGRAQRTKERIYEYEDPYHVDWWIYHGHELDISERFRFCEE